MKKSISERGNFVVEFVLVLPFVMLLFGAVMKISKSCIVSELEMHRVNEFSRISKVYNSDYDNGRIVRALTTGLSDSVVRGGDSPLPYCKEGDGYFICGYPK